MKQRILCLQTLFFVLVVFFAVSSPSVVLGSTADVVLQWGNANWLGVGPRAVGQQFIPPTPTGVFDDHYTVPLDGSQYFRATNGLQTLLIVRKNGYNHWFLSGQMVDADAPNPPTYPSPVNITHTIAGGYTSLETVPILKVELLEYMIAVLIDFDPQHNISALVTFSLTDSGFIMPLGRTGPDPVPAIVAYRSYDDREKVFLACGHCYCFYANATNATLISPSAHSCAGNLNDAPELDFTSNPIRNVFPYHVAFLILHVNNSFTAFGNNEHTRFGGATGWQVYADGVILPKSIPDIIDGACGYYHCIFLQSTGQLLGVGKNDNGECGLPPSSVVAYASEGDALQYITQPPNFGHVITVGAVLSASFALTDNGLWAWGGVTGYNGGLLESSFLFGFPYAYSTGTSMPLKNLLIPPGIKLLEAPRLSTFKDDTPQRMAIGVRAQMSLSDYYTMGRTTTLSPITNISTTMSTVIAWGSHSTDWGQGGPPLGNRSLNSYSRYANVPVVVEIPYAHTSDEISSVAVGTDTIFAVSASGNSPSNKLFAWGQLDTRFPTAGQMIQQSAFPLPIALQGRSFLAVAQARDFGSAIYFNPNFDVSLLTWTSSGDHDRSIASGVNNPNLASPRGALKCGDYHCGYLDHPGSSQNLLLWSNSSLSTASNPPLCRQSGDNRDFGEPIAVNNALFSTNNILDFALGWDFTIFVVQDGITGSKLYGCGDSAWGQILGQRSLMDTVTYLDGTDGILQVAAGKSHVVGVTGGGAVYAWGKNDFGQAGIVYTDINYFLNPISSLTSVIWVAAVQDTSFAMDGYGDLWVWGRNDYMNMFGDPHLQGYARSYVPLKTEIQNAMGVKGKINQIFSSSFAWQVYARMTPETGTLTNAIEPSFKAFWGGYDPVREIYDRPITSPTNAEFIATSNEMATPTLADDEYIVHANLGAGFISYITNTSRIFIAGRNTNNGGTPIFTKNFVDNRQDDFAPRLALPNPIFAWQHPEPVKKIQNTELGVLILQEDGVLKSLDKSTGLVSASPVMSGNFTEIDCVTSSGSSTCGYLDSNGNLSLWSLTSQNSLLNMTDVDHFALVGSYHPLNSMHVQVLIVSGNQILVQDVSNSNNYQIVNGNFPSSATVVKVVGGYDYWLILSDEGKLYGIGTSVNFGLPSTAGIDSGVQPVYHAELEGLQILDMAASTSMSFVLTDAGVYGWGILPSAYTYNFTKINDMLSSWPNLAATSPVLMPLPVLEKFGFVDKYSSSKPLVGGIATCKEDGAVLDASYLVKDAYLMWRNIPPPSVPASPSFVPTNPPNPSNVPAPGCAPPPTSDPAWTCNVATGVLFYNGSFSVPLGQETTINGPISIEGDFNVPAGSSLKITFNGDIKARLNSETPLINVSGCAQVDQSMNVDLDNDAKKVLSKQKGDASVQLVESSCPQTPGKLLVDTPPEAQKGCRRYTAQQSETKNGPRTTISATLTISRDSCNHWWIILISVVCTVIVVVAIVVLVVMLTPLKTVVLPYFKSN